MSCKIEKSKLTDAQKTNLVKKLTFIPVTNNYSNYDTPSEPIYFYQTTSTHVIIPYITAATELQIIPNEDKEYKKYDLEFTGKLREHQVSIVDEAFQHLETYGTTTLALSPGTCKISIIYQNE